MIMHSKKKITQEKKIKELMPSFPQPKHHFHTTNNFPVNQKIKRKRSYLQQNKPSEVKKILHNNHKHKLKLQRFINFFLFKEDPST